MNIYATVIFIVAMVAAMAGIYYMGRREGKNQYRINELEFDLKAVEKYDKDKAKVAEHYNHKFDRDSVLSGEASTRYKAPVSGDDEGKGH